MRLQSVVVYFFCIQFALGPLAQAANMDLPPSERPQIRNKITDCETMLVPTGQVDDSVGIPFSGNSPEHFAQELKKDIEVYGLEKFRNGTFYVLGTPMQNEHETEKSFQEIIEAQHVDSVGAKVKVLSVPAQLINDESIGLARGMLQRMRYFFPSLKRDLQAPQWGEIVSDWKATLAIESVNVYFLFQGMPPAQAGLVVATHAIILNAYTIWTKSMLNFLFRPSYKNKLHIATELFLRQMLLSLPFVLNYNIFGRLSDITNFYAKWGWQKTMAHFPYELAHFGETQGLTLFLQTVFYANIVTKGYGAWVDSQVGDQNTRDARTLRPLLQIPVLATDAVLLMLSANDWHPLLQLGAFDFNAGHAGLIGLTAGMWMFFKKFPRAFDPILAHYQARRAKRAAIAAAKLTEPAE